MIEATVTISCNTIARSLDASSGQFKKQSVFIEGRKTRLKFSGEKVRKGGQSSLLYGRSPIKHDIAAVPFYLPFILYAGTSYGICDSRKRARQPNRLLVVIKDTSLYQRTMPSFSGFFFLLLFGRPLHYFVYLMDDQGALSGTRLCRIISRM